MTVLMRLRFGLLIGFALGYYLGSMAGRERYEQMNRVIRKIKRSDAYEAATEKAKAVVDLGVERARDAVEDKFGNGETAPTSPYTSSR
jgi:hypothetical protein